MEITFNHFDYLRELEQQRKLFNECFPESEGTESGTKEHYFWKFHSKPGPLKSMEYAAYIGDNLVGYYAALPYYYQFQNNPLNIGMVCDVMTGVKARGKGVFAKLGIYSTTEIGKLGFGITTGYPIRPEVLPGHLKAGWHITLELPLYMSPVSFKSFLQKKNMGFISPLIDLVNNIIKGLINFIFVKKNSKIKVETHSSADILKLAELTTFFSEWQKELPISLIKDKGFLSWRLSAPGKKYEIIRLIDDGKIVGVLIAGNIEKEGIPCMGILDVSILCGYYKYSALMLNALKAICKKNKRELILIMISKYWAKKYIIKKALFIKTPFKFNLILKNLNMQGHEQSLKKPENWHVMWLDSDNL